VSGSSVPPLGHPLLVNTKGVLLIGYPTAGRGSRVGAGHRLLGWNDTGIAFFAGTPVAKQTVAAAATDAATTQTLANSLRALILAYTLA
jgi:hypothetical protein